MKLNHAQPETVNREAELRRPMGVGSGALLGHTVEFKINTSHELIMAGIMCGMATQMAQVGGSTPALNLVGNFSPITSTRGGHRES
jgi:hypothetical protein